MASIDSKFIELEVAYKQITDILNKAFINNQILINNLKETLKENERLRIELNQIKLANMPQRGLSKPKTFNGVSIE